MTFLTPLAAGIAAAIAIPALVLMYFLKLRRREMVVSSTLLWKKAIQDLQVNTPFQRLRKNLLLLVQLLLLIALLLALARPTVRLSAVGGERMILLIDHSASMNATDEKPTRLDAAKAWALAKVDEFAGAGGVMIVAFADQARVLQPFTTDKTLLRAAIGSIAPTDRSSRLGPALQLVEPYALDAGAVPGAGGKSLSVLVLSDGRMTAEPNLSLRGGELKAVRFGKADGGGPDNLAIVALSARRDLTHPQRVQVFARLANYGTQRLKANVMLSIDGRLRTSTAVNVPATAGLAPDAQGMFAPPGTESVQFEFSASGAVMIGLNHDHADDLPADNAGWVYLAPPKHLRVLLVSAGNAFLERAIDAAGVREMMPMSPERYEQQSPATLRRGAGRSEGFDLIVFDNYSPKTVPLVDSVYFGGVPPIKDLALKAGAKDDPSAQKLLSWNRMHPLLRYVALDDVIFVEPGRLTLPDGATVLATAQSGPVLADVSRDGVRHVVASFVLLKTNWPMQVSFTVFMVNAVQALSLAGGAQGMMLQPGDVVSAPAAGEGQDVVYEGPMRLSAKSQQGHVVLPALERVGVYETRGNVAPPWDRLTVNLCDGNESDLRPAQQLRVGATAAPLAGARAAAQQEVWHWFILGALALLMVEWLIYTRRMHL